MKTIRSKTGRGGGWRRLLRRALSDPRRGELGLYAAHGTYCLILSLGPLAAVLLAVLPYTPLTREQLLQGLLAWAPGPMRQLVQSAVGEIYARPAAALPVALGLELWSGARFLASVVRAVGALRGGGGGYLRRRLLGAGFTALLAVVLLGDLALLLAGRRMLGWILLTRPKAAPLWKGLMGLRPALLLGGLTGGNVLLFRCAAPGRGRAPQWPGAVLAAAGWMGFSRGFSWALERFGLFGVYGGIAAVAASMGWLYGSLYILYAGAWLNTLLDPAKEIYGEEDETYGERNITPE